MLDSVRDSGAWTLFGAALSRLLTDPRVTRPFNWTMAALLVAWIAPVIFERTGPAGAWTNPAIAAKSGNHALPAWLPGSAGATIPDCGTGTFLRWNREN